MNEPQINIEDIDCPEERGQVKGLLEDLIQLCPSDSTVRATVRKLSPHRFIAEIRVASETVIMHAADQAAVLGEALDQLKSNLLRQIVVWRNRRFAS